MEVDERLCRAHCFDQRADAHDGHGAESQPVLELRYALGTLNPPRGSCPIAGSQVAGGAASRHRRKGVALLDS